ncbi:MAG TPA: chemotaxis response regulator protein-glutamate methylesterase [Candidatus Sulfotelmatobacter sp.]|nr:chemotaxis response regulator protein-glutamate methylesterase [Candidatus Sulfotelmatobacter sp.]
MNAGGTSVFPVRVLVVDDSAFMRAALSRIINSDPSFQVVGAAAGGSDALAKIPALDPDVITLDVQMPGMDGLTTLKAIMNQFPRPVIMVSAVTEQDADITFQALSAGAFDYVPKQMSSTSLEIAHIRSDLLAKIRAAAQARHVFDGRRFGRKPPRAAELPRQAPNFAKPALVAMASSTGGPRALEQILPRFPKDFPLPILIVQHMPAGFTRTFAQRLRSLCAIDVHEAVQREVVGPGAAYICPAGRHMRVQRASLSGQVLIFLDKNPAHALHIPSADVLMESVANVYGSRALGVIMTGMGSDGAQGMKAIYHEGGLTIGQDEATCTVYGMPRACAELGVLARIVPLHQIPEEILGATRRRMPA